MLVRSLCRECAEEYGKKGFRLRALTKKAMKKEPCEGCRRRGETLLYELGLEEEQWNEGRGRRR